jgi:hypothetical protein
MTSPKIPMTFHAPFSHPTRSTSRSRLAWRSAGFLALLALGWSATARAYPVAFPARGDSLPADVYFEARGHVGDYGTSTWSIDIRAMAQEGTQWSGYVGGDNTANANAYIFGAPLFAPEDGEIISCWRSAPNKLNPSTQYDIDGDGIFGEENADEAPVGAGNHIQLRNADGDHIIFLAHLSTNSIPAGLCPLPANRDADLDGWPDSRTKNSCSGTSGYSGFMAGTMLPTPVPVKAGDFLGRVGHSGASSGPHLHMHVTPFELDPLGRPCQGPIEEIEFVEAWAQNCETNAAVTAAGWDPLTAENPLETAIWTSTPNPDPNEPQFTWVGGDRYCFLPDAIGAEQDHNWYGTGTTNIHPTTHTSGDLLVYQSGGALQLRSYKLGSTGIISDQSTVTEGAVFDVAVARPGSARDVVVSVKDGNGNLKHIPYTVSSNLGAIVRQNGKELSESAVGQVETTKSPAHDGYVAALEDGAGNLKVIDYHVDAAMNITRDFSSSGSGGAIDDVAITTLTTAFDGVVTAEITSGGFMVLRSFDVPAAGGVTWADTYTSSLAVDAVKVDTVPVMFGLGEFIVTSVRLSGTETLRLDTWAVDASGQISWVDGTTAGVASALDAAPTQFGGDLVVTLRDDDDNFRMVGWGIDMFGAITRHATHVEGAVTGTSIIASFSGGQNHLVAARTDSVGRLNLFVYGAAFMPQF